MVGLNVYPAHNNELCDSPVYVIQSDSGVVGRFQRCSEQLVLHGKALSLLDALSTRYGLELALAPYDEPPQPIAASEC